MAKGKLIVLEGIDGSGKSAQYRRLCKQNGKGWNCVYSYCFPALR